MGKRARVVWSEGLLLTPQHLQHQDRYFEESSAELFRASRPFNHGFISLTLDEEAIQNGQVVVQDAAGVTRNGIPFSFPDRDGVPAGRSIEQHFPVGMDSLPVYVGIRIHRPGEREISDGENGALRYRRGQLNAYDQTTGENEREILVCHPVLRVLFPGENLGDYDHLQVAEVVRKPEGGYVYREDYVPPCLTIAASGYVLRILARIQENLVARSKSLSDRRQHRGQGVAEFGREDVAGFWLLGTVNGYIPVLSHFLREKTDHPETVYFTLAAMAGELTTMSDLDVLDTPAYQHENLGATFAGLAQRLPQMLKEVLPQAYERIPLEEKEESVFVGEISDERLLEPGVSFYLGVFASLSEQEIRTQFPEKVKIAPPDQMDSLIAIQVKGVEVRHLAGYPSSLPVRSGYIYFKLEKTGEVWDLVSSSRSIAIYVPAPEFPGVHMELIAVKGQV